MLDCEGTVLFALVEEDLVGGGLTPYGAFRDV